MSTINSPEIIEEILQNNGIYNGDPPVVAIYLYTSRNVSGEQYAVFYNSSQIDMHSSPSVSTYTPLFINGKITTTGTLWLKEREGKRNA